MKKQTKLLLASIGMGITGWLSIGIGYTSTMGSTLNGILFMGGLLLCFIALIVFILSFKQHE